MDSCGLSMVEGIFSLLFYCESGINQYAGQKPLTNIFGASLLLLELSCFKNIVIPFKMLHVFMRR